MKWEWDTLFDACLSTTNQPANDQLTLSFTYALCAKWEVGEVLVITGQRWFLIVRKSLWLCRQLRLVVHYVYGWWFQMFRILLWPQPLEKMSIWRALYVFWMLNHHVFLYLSSDMLNCWTNAEPIHRFSHWNYTGMLWVSKWLITMVNNSPK